MIELNLTAAKKTSVGKKLISGKQFEPEIANILLWLFNKVQNGLFIDVGSNIGFFPLLLGKFAKTQCLNLTIYAHEPLPLLLDISRKLQSENEIAYNLRSSALSDKIGHSDFYVSAVSDSSNSLVKGFRKTKDVLTVRVNTFDNAYMKLLDTGGFDEKVLMIDVETAEPAVLRGGCKSILKHRPVIICEVLAGRNEAELNEFFSSVDYVGYRFNGQHWVQENKIYGDKVYHYRDWLFLPIERAKVIGSQFEVPRRSITGKAI
jgi:FkbM family methyltransferase